MHCLTKLFTIYQNKHWTIRWWDDCAFHPLNHCIILRIVRFQEYLTLQTGSGQCAVAVTLSALYYSFPNSWDLHLAYTYYSSRSSRELNWELNGFLLFWQNLKWQNISIWECENVLDIASHDKEFFITSNVTCKLPNWFVLITCSKTKLHCCVNGL